MVQLPEVSELAMPLGLPTEGVDPEDHYRDMRSHLSTEITADGIVRIWVLPNPLHENVHSMVRAAVRYYPAGNIGPDGEELETDALIFKTWPWEYLSLRRSAGMGGSIPPLIRIGHIDTEEMRALVAQEMETNPRYEDRTASERTQIQTDFMAGNINLLVAPGTPLVKGNVDPAPPGPEMDGYRRIDLAFLASDGSILDPALCFEIWGMIGGANVDDHPLLECLSRPVTPGAAPLEGGTRIKIRGEGFTHDTTLTVGGNPVSEVRMADEGNLLYATVTSGTEGVADMVISTPDQPSRTISPGLRYVADVAETARAAMQSFNVYLSELRDRAESLDASGDLDENARIEISLELEFAHRWCCGSILQRSAAGGGPANSPTIAEIQKKNSEIQSLLMEEVTALIITAP